MSDIRNSVPITSVARTVCELLGVSAPEGAAPAAGPVMQKAAAVWGEARADRAFIYDPDAVALWLYQKYTELMIPAVRAADMALPMLSVMPSVTPVCFASIYSGLMPEGHGIQSYIKPVLRVDTVFDALIRAGKRPAIVSTAGDSISHIFLERDMDYFIYDTPEECNAKALELIERDEHDLITLYNGNYDGTMHRFGPESPEALAVLEENCRVYERMVKAVKTFWGGRRTFMGFCPDHGCHEIDGNLGSHGLDMPEDMNIIHMFSFLG